MKNILNSAAFVTVFIFSFLIAPFSASASIERTSLISLDLKNQIIIIENEEKMIVQNTSNYTVCSPEQMIQLSQKPDVEIVPNPEFPQMFFYLLPGEKVACSTDFWSPVSRKVGESILRRAIAIAKKNHFKFVGEEWSGVIKNDNSGVIHSYRYGTCTEEKCEIFAMIRLKVIFQ